MISKRDAPPPFSPFLLLGLAVRPLPLAPLQVVLSRIMATMVRRHPEVFERLSDLENPVFLINPQELPFSFVLNLNAESPSLSAVREPETPEVTTAISGSLQDLIDLMEGRADGDALFFSRNLSVEGDMEAVVALRNALDGSDVDLINDILEELGPLASPARKGLGVAAGLYDRLSRDMETLRDAITDPGDRRADVLAGKVDRLSATLANRDQNKRTEIVT